MRLPGERFGSMFTRFRFDKPFHLISVYGGLEMNVQAMNKNKLIYGNDEDGYKRLRDLIEDLRTFSIKSIVHKLASADEIIIDNDVVGECNKSHNDIVTTLPLVKSIASSSGIPLSKESKQLVRNIVVKQQNQSDISYIVNFMISYPKYNYIYDTKSRKHCFECLHQYIAENKQSYKFNEITKITNSKDYGVIGQSNVQVKGTSSMFSVIFANLGDLNEFLEFRILFVDSYKTYFHEYIPLVSNRNVVLQESAVYSIITSTLGMIITLMFDYSNPANMYLAEIVYEDIRKIEGCVNDMIQYFRSLEISGIGYDHDRENRKIVIYDINCCMKEYKQGYLADSRNTIQPLCLTIIDNIIYEHEVADLYDVD